MTGQLIANPNSWPGWLTVLWNREPRGTNSLFTATNGSGVSAIVAIDHMGDLHEVVMGDYLLRITNDLVYMQRDAFESTYEELV